MHPAALLVVDVDPVIGLQLTNASGVNPSTDSVEATRLPTPLVESSRCRSTLDDAPISASMTEVPPLLFARDVAIWR